ncbi:hypothetical protein CB0940_04524 [Cercospora beticola]|uniref:Uncharacterized protein n=1 Tax=Cercospora beticola TaxID=122368 RepID=A0A2G5HIX9_CERBT|nr:hypothetical protein CB0940_04524 [Cercospora beticola]PIA92514.1 hypothetical protein CB0940_04524 [Cercospora beticola]WPB01771.1 hypothetical protein RHO25_006403 [Cercospora beticola]CAK1363402.1 unnamed protein product [Cercospora beticola]
MPARNRELTVPYEKYPLMRLALHQLRLHYPTLNSPARLDIFNAIFHDQLEEEGFEDGKVTSHDKLDSQYRESRKEKNKQKWSGIIKHQDDLDDEDFKVYQTMMALIKVKGRELGKEMVSTGNGSSDEEDEDEDDDSEEDQPIFESSVHMKNGRTYPAGDIGLAQKYSGAGSSGDTMRLYKTYAGEEDSGDDGAPGPSRKGVAKKAKKGKKASGKKGN